jgi:hypothetical protein
MWLSRVGVIHQEVNHILEALAAKEAHSGIGWAHLERNRPEKQFFGWSPVLVFHVSPIDIPPPPQYL